ncbi:MAG: hypothetical protein ABIE03_05715 [Patescibacteria group bacterium]|nr:hypothetical protein [Patescibacteria group bacterium]
MKKCNYRVIKPFNLEKSNDKLIIVADSGLEVAGFRRNAQYVDYVFPKQGLDESGITKELLDRKFIKLVSETKI